MERRETSVCSGTLRGGGSGPAQAVFPVSGKRRARKWGAEWKGGRVGRRLHAGPCPVGPSRPPSPPGTPPTTRSITRVAHPTPPCPAPRGVLSGVSLPPNLPATSLESGSEGFGRPRFHPLPPTRLRFWRWPLLPRVRDRTARSFWGVSQAARRGGAWLRGSRSWTGLPGWPSVVHCSGPGARSPGASARPPNLGTFPSSPALPFQRSLALSLTAMQEASVRFLGREDPLEKEMATHSSILIWKIPWTEEATVHGVTRVRHDWATKTTTTTKAQLIKKGFKRSNNNRILFVKLTRLCKYYFVPMIILGKKQGHNLATKLQGVSPKA